MILGESDDECQIPVNDDNMHDQPQVKMTNSRELTNEQMIGDDIGFQDTVHKYGLDNS